MRSFEVESSGRRPGYPYVVGHGAIRRARAFVRARYRGAAVAVVADARVARLHARRWCEDLDSARGGPARAALVTFPSGERSKTRATAARIERRLAALDLGRDGAVVAFGGGVTGDLAGFVAATWLRGVDLVHVPTSLLAMVDASIGGKTGIDIEAGKNLVGAFHDPVGVFADTGVLRTLSPREFRCGLSEIVKTFAVADRAAFEALEADRSIFRFAPATGIAPARVGRAVPWIERAARTKASIVARDRLEGGERAVLNFGHTVAHGLERATGYRMRHGDAVAIGMVVEARLAAERTRFPRDSADRLEALLRGLGLPTRVPRRIDLRAAIRAMRHDKKNRAGEIRCALPRSLGRFARGAWTTAVDEAALAAALEAARTR